MNAEKKSLPRISSSPVKKLLPYLWPAGNCNLQARVILTLALLIVGKIGSVFVPIFYKHAVDALAPQALIIGVPLGIILSYGSARIIALGFNELKEALFARVGQKAVHQIAFEAFRHLHQLSLRFHLDRKTGGLSRAIERGTRGIETLLRFAMFNILPTIFEILFVSIALWILYDTTFLAITIGTLIVYVVFTLWVTHWRTAFVRSMNKVDSEANTKAIDSLLNYETVKYFNNESHEEKRFDASLQLYEDAAVKSKITLALLNTGQGFIIAVGLTIIMLMAAFHVVNHTMTVGDFVLVNSYLVQLYMPLNILGFAYREIKLALVDMEEMFKLLHEHQEIGDAPNASDLIVKAGGIVFDKVSFAYNPERPILKNFSLIIPPCQTIAIVGASGAGKSTLSRLLFRFYDVTQGAIYIDDQDICSVTQSSVRKAIGIVPQDTVLFNDTIYYNIAYGKPDASPEDVYKAAKLAHIHEFIMRLPDGYETMVGERGLKLSGGEKQRVAIARTILKQPSIFVFDEATSSLDTHTEKEIQESLKQVSRNRTTLLIAHRLSTVIDADEIVVLQDGEIVERGKHQALLKKKGVYFEMWEKQRTASFELPEAL